MLGEGMRREVGRMESSASDAVWSACSAGKIFLEINGAKFVIFCALGGHRFYERRMANISAANAHIYKPFSIRDATRRCRSFALMGYVAKRLLGQAYCNLVSLHFDSPNLSGLLGFQSALSSIVFPRVNDFSLGSR